jgi:hypothetical protein
MLRGLIASDRRLAAALFLVPFVTYAWFFSGGGWNQNAHFDLARALVERQTLYIDGYRVNTGDVSWSAVGGEWHAYINKPPGASFLAALPYALVYAVERALNMSVDTWGMMTINAWIVTALTCGVAGALIPVVLYFYARRRAGVTPLVATAAALSIAFGSIVFPYSTTLMAHVPSALFLLLALVWLDDRPLLAGICAGIAGTCNYLCIPAAAVLALGALVRSRRAALWFVAGGIPFGILLALYHDWCFGSPFTTAVEVSTTFTEKGKFLGVFAMPSQKALWGLTFSEFRGLFFSAPVLLLAFVGAFNMLRRRVFVRELVMIAAMVGIFLFSVASFNNWNGGSAFGPRYLLTIVPLFAIPMLFAGGRQAILPVESQRTRRMVWPLRILAALWLVLGLASVAQQFVATAVDPLPASGIRKPTRMYHLPVLRTGLVPPELFKDVGWALGPVGRVSVNPQTIDEIGPLFVYPYGTKQSKWASFNAGEIVTGSGQPASVIPIALWMLGGSALLLATARRSW